MLVVLERKMRENGVEANHFKRRQGVSLFIRAPITLIRIAADWVQGIDMRALEALRKEASKRGVHDDRNVIDPQGWVDTYIRNFRSLALTSTECE